MRASFLALLCALGVSALGVCQAANPAPLSDSQILGIYIQVNGFDIETALLGRANAGSEAVRQLAAHVASDHTGVRQMAFALAATCKVQPSTPVDRNAAAAEHADVLTRLAALKERSSTRRTSSTKSNSIARRSQRCAARCSRRRRALT